jgi:hypothetical protein
MAKDALSVHSSAEPAPASAVRGYAYVRLRHAIQAGDTAYAPETRGVIVHRHADGVGYEVEFELQGVSRPHIDRARHPAGLVTTYPFN